MSTTVFCYVFRDYCTSSFLTVSVVLSLCIFATIWISSSLWFLLWFGFRPSYGFCCGLNIVLIIVFFCDLDIQVVLVTVFVVVWSSFSLRSEGKFCERTEGGQGTNL